MRDIISIIITCYNQALYLDQCISSVLNQTSPNWECIIVNDGSTDNTEDVIFKWLKKDNRFQYISSLNKGVSNARNIGIEKAIGTYILPLDGDDVFGLEYVERGLLEFDKYPDLKVVYCQAEKFGTETGKWELQEYNKDELLFSNMIFCSAIFKKEDWKSIGGFDVNMTLGLEDWEFWIALLKKGGKVTRLNYTGFFYRIKNESRQTSLNKSQEQKEQMQAYISTKHADDYIKYLGSFHKLLKDRKDLKKLLHKQKTDKKLILNLFLKTFFGFKLFKDHNL